MKIFESKQTPNGRRVRMFLAEKGIADMEYIQVNIKDGENLSADFITKNPSGRIPVLELDDGSYISETVAICRYFEELNPGTPLFGGDPKSKAVIEMWQRRVELNYYTNVAYCFRNVTGFFKDRETPVKEWGEICGVEAMKFYDVLEQQLADNEFIAGDQFSIADITGICAMDFAKVMKLNPEERHVNVQRWRKQISARPSAQA